MKKYEIVITPEIHDAIIAEGLEIYAPDDNFSLIGCSCWYEEETLYMTSLWSYFDPHCRVPFYMFLRAGNEWSNYAKENYPEWMI